MRKCEGELGLRKWEDVETERYPVRDPPPIGGGDRRAGWLVAETELELLWRVPENREDGGAAGGFFEPSSSLPSSPTESRISVRRGVSIESRECEALGAEDCSELSAGKSFNRSHTWKKG